MFRAKLDLPLYRGECRTIADLDGPGKSFGEDRIGRLAFVPADGFAAAMRMSCLIFAFVLLGAGTAAAADVSVLDDPSLGGRDRYDNCLLLIRQNASRAFDAAAAWETSGGNGAATHCAALALVALKRYGEAGARLDQLGRTTGSSADRAELYDQAGNAYLLGRRAQEAQTSFTTALQLSPGDPDVLADRARAFAMKANWQAAEADLTAALLRNARRADLLVLRASARHALGRKQDARADLDLALGFEPNNAEALVERGEMKLEDGDQAGARSDWQSVIDRSPRSAAAADAKQHMDALNQPAATPAPKTTP